MATTDTAPDATGLDTTGPDDSDPVTSAAPMDRSFVGYIGCIGFGAGAPDAVVLAAATALASRQRGTNRPSDET